MTTVAYWCCYHAFERGFQAGERGEPCEPPAFNEQASPHDTVGTHEEVWKRGWRAGRKRYNTNPPLSTGTYEEYVRWQAERLTQSEMFHMDKIAEVLVIMGATEEESRKLAVDAYRSIKR